MNTKEIDILFPGEEVVIKIGDKEVPILVTPLMLSDLPKVAKAFGRLMRLTESGAIKPAELAAVGLEELLILVPYCIDFPANRVPSTEVPPILEVVIRQNITEEIVGKWKSLVQSIIENARIKELSGTLPTK